MILISKHVVYSIQAGLSICNWMQPKGAFKMTFIVMQHRVGCRVCGAKRSSRFREWRSYSHLEGFVGVEFKAPESDVICNKCHRAADRQTLKVRANLRQFARSLPFVFRQ